MKIPHSRLSTFDFESADSRLGRMTLSTKARGFTVIELAVVLGIFSVLTGVVLSRYRDYTASASFANASEDVVLALRQAQVYGAGGKQSDVVCGTAGSYFECRYGVSFSEGSDNFTLFVDKNGNHIYDPVSTDVEKIETIEWSSPIKIKDLSCGGGESSCLNDNTMSVTFSRPSPDAWIADLGDVGGATGYPSYDFGEITLTNGPRESIVTVSKAGQISVR